MTNNKKGLKMCIPFQDDNKTVFCVAPCEYNKHQNAWALYLGKKDQRTSCPVSLTWNPVSYKNQSWYLYKKKNSKVNLESAFEQTL